MRPCLPALTCNQTGLHGVIVYYSSVPLRIIIAGTWFGVSRSGRIGFLTNYTVPTAHIRRDAEGRGSLVTHYLTSAATPLAYAADVAQGAAHYNGFNLVVGDFSSRRAHDDEELTSSSSMAYLGTQCDPIVSIVRPGAHCLSNRTLHDRSWPKVRVRQSLSV